MNILGKSVVAYYVNINFSSSFSFRSKSNKGNVRTSNDARLCVCCAHVAFIYGSSLKRLLSTNMKINYVDFIVDVALKFPFDDSE